MTSFYRDALLKANEVRNKLGFDMFEPINIFDACLELGLTVRFLDVNMEGMYVTQDSSTNSTILLSSLRPLPRRCYTCGHELGHHEFKHGTRVDSLADENGHQTSNRFEEILVDCFAGALLMPDLGIQAEFTQRNWSVQNATPIQFYTICSVFGTGYRTLITHCKANKLITEFKAKELLRITPAKIFKDLFPSSTLSSSYFKLFDGHSKINKIDLEVSNHIIVPTKTIIEGNHLQKCQETDLGDGYIAIKPGIVRVFTEDSSFSSFIRIQNYQYTGLTLIAAYR